MWIKESIGSGHDVRRFACRNILTQFNSFSGKHFRRFMPKFVKRYTDELLAGQIKACYPDFVLIFGKKYLYPKTTKTIRGAAPNGMIAGRDEDQFPDKNQDTIPDWKMPAPLSEKIIVAAGEEV
jgi:hypothetical protein